MNYARLGKNLERARKESRLKQSDMAAALGVARTTVVAIEQGKRKVKADELEKIWKITGIPVADLIAGCEDDTPSSVVKQDKHYVFLDDVEHHLIKLIRHRKWLATIEMIINLSQDEQ